MGVSPEQLAAILNKSRDLCNENGDRLVQKNMKNTPMSRDYDPDPNEFHDEWDNFSLSESTSSPKAPVYNEASFKNSHMRSDILESIKNNPIQQNDSPSLNMALDMAQKQMPKRQPVQETRVPVQQYQPTAAIDYSIIKAIVKECIAEYFSKQPLNEGATLKQIGLSNGKIKLVDNKGNIFAAPLEYEGNLKDRKKKQE